MKFSPKENSMVGKINSGQLCTVVPVDIANLKVGDIVLCKVRGRQYLHLVKAISETQVLIGNNRDKINGWTSKKCLWYLYKCLVIL